MRNARILGPRFSRAHYYPNELRTACPESRHRQLGASRKRLMRVWRLGLRTHLRPFSTPVAPRRLHVKANTTVSAALTVSQESSRGTCRQDTRDS